MTRDSKGNTPLILAASKGHVECVQWLLCYGAGVNVTNAFGDTALHFASEGWHNDVCLILLRCGADTEIANAVGVTPANILYGDDEGHDDERDYFRDEPEYGREVQDEDWNQKMQYEMGFEQGEAFGGWSAYADEGDREDEESYRQRIVREMHKKHAKASVAAAKQVDEKVAERQQKEAEYAEVLRKEKERDAAWRREVAAKAHAKKGMQDRSEYEMQWAAMKRGETATLSVDSVPWPPGVSLQQPPTLELLRGFYFAGYTGDAAEAKAFRKKALRREQLRWHPDKFTQSIAARLPANMQKVVLARAMEVSQLLNSLASAEAT